MTDNWGYIGYNASSNGSATISSGTWTSTTDLTVGYSGTGTMVVNGGRVENVRAFVGFAAGSSGGVTVTSGTWASSGNLTVGNSGVGTLVVNGGSVTNTKGYLGSSGVGTATVGGGIWDNSDTLYVGFVGNGTLNVTGSGEVKAGGGAGTVFLGYYVGSAGTLNMGTGGATGTLTAGTVTGRQGTATVNFNHTGDATFAPSLTGPITVNKTGPGTTILDGNNTYSGITTASQGLLQVDTNARLGSSTLRLNGGGIRYGAAFNDLRGITLGGSGGTLDTNGYNVSYASSLSGSGALTKSGLGSLTLAASNSYGGGTTITQGTIIAGNTAAFGTGGITVGSVGTLDLGGLAVSNAITNSGGSVVNAGGYAGTQSVTGVVSMTGTVGGIVNVVAGGELKGSQTVFNGLVTVASGAEHSPGNSPGTQTFAAGISYDTGSIFSWELIANSATGAGTNYDFLSVTGGSLAISAGAIMNLDFSGTGSTVDWNDSFWSVAHSWTVIDATAATSSTGNFTLGSVGVDAFGQSLSVIRPDATFEIARSGDNVVLQFVVVPEPSTTAMAIAGLVWGGWSMWRVRGRRGRMVA